MEQKLILKVDNLNVGFNNQNKQIKLLDNISFEVKKGQIIGIIGESGSGKTLTALSIMKMLPYNLNIMSGKINFMNNDIICASESDMKIIRGKQISMIFQNPMTSLCPVYRISSQLYDVIRENNNLLSKDDVKIFSHRLLRSMGIQNVDNFIKKYPHELSGGMRQRVVIAMAISASPKLLIADEPTTALDPLVQEYSLYLLKNFNDKLNNSILIITHDFSVVKKICTDVIVMKKGHIVEMNTVDNILHNPQDKYTRQLLELADI